MEKRKIQRTGGSSFSITLPKKWIETHKLKEQDFVIVSFRYGDSLAVLAPSVVQKRIKGEIHSDKLREEELKRELIACYVLGFEKVEILGKAVTKEKRLAVRDITQTLVGFEIVEDYSSKIVLKNILSPEKFSFQESISKMLSMTHAMFQDAIVSISENKKELARNVIERDLDIDKLYFLILRQNHLLFQNRIFEEKLNLSLEKALYYEGIATQLERIADHAVKITQLVATNHLVFSKKLNQTLQELAQKLLSLLQDTEYFVRNIDKLKAHKTLNAARKIDKDINAFSQEIVKGGFVRAVILSDSLDRLRGYIMNMAELTIDQAIVEENK